MTIQNIISQLGEGMLKTCLLFFSTLVISLPLGLIISFGRMSKWTPFGGKFKPVNMLARIYISIMRGTPLMLQIMVVYFGPYYLFGIKISSSYQIYAAIIAFAINYAAYFAEIYRGGIESISQGQYEAAHILGFTKAQTFFKIILPQVMKRILPSVTNEVITLVKDTSLAFVIAYAEMFTMAKRIAAKETSMIPFVAAGIFYYIFNLIVALVMNGIEKKMSYYK
ncbi:MAG: amino acid ABC transporter permease [Clostridia bacterium]|nr:amino acid ABC transporter permease [Clostridia bacterium]MBQ2346820.1 amino acid ABC transporter permease [Clostridia bacterium]